MKRLTIQVVLILLICSGCSLFQSNSSLMKPPQLPVQQQELKQAISQYVPAQAEWLSPLDDGDTNHIIERDLDGDGEEELIVFYRMPDKTAQMEGVILENLKGEWKKRTQFSDLGRELQKVEFADLDGDGKDEVLIGFSYSNESSDKALLVFNVSGDKPEKLFESQYSAFFADDYNEDGRGELMLATLVPNQEHNVTLYSYEDNMEKVDELKLDPYVYPYYHTAAGYVTPSVKGAVLDSSVGAHSSTSFIIGVKDGKLKEVKPKGLKEEDLFRATAANSIDTNDDGIIEIPVLVEGSEDKPYVDMPFISEYYQLMDDGEARFVESTYENVNYQYTWKLPDSWPDVEIDTSGDRRYVKFISKEDGTVLYDIYAVEKDKVIPDEGWNELSESNQFIYLTKYSPERYPENFQAN
ncbi:FG-GAP repeat domain-containing protein [Rossellomorea marisflavi]|uniref:FG-GAP repeat domain-containing protein n=1 Tax=Rossellomorea marisflavi TaxID=189381 RepID=UPI0034580AB4